ncbi:adenine phosphoribosyltransferase [Candidozyma duobushaemuli]|uniref:Adenine phosphoribosyltransferase n=1 Tax=Candidozyma duobushaemuli TaxID=1231522 RepID=A0A2V1AH31_9ASCO|nr:adenine phosphoribosyltransferase [[Candida] duobushaemulonis]PVH16914.1 adenine phosphoribosyltransferase [[Candida] duobushaemulonis]
MTEIETIAQELKSSLKQFENFPQEGILFEDFLPIFAKPDLFRKLVQAFQIHLGDTKIDYIVGLESRGIRSREKAWKASGPTLRAEFQKEYGKDSFEIQEGVLPKGSKVVIVDDILATGGSASAAGELVSKAGADVLEYLFVMELEFLKGRDILKSPSFTLLSGQKK